MSFIQRVLIPFTILNVAFCLEFPQMNNRSGIQILFPETEQYQTQEIPIDLARQLNNLSTVEEFFNLMDSEEAEIADRMGFGPLEKSSPGNEKAGKCMPEYTTISLKPSQSPTAFYYPRCARVKRCGGCCLHDLFTCRPIEKEVIPFMTVVAEYRGGQRFHLLERKIIEIEQHTKCECGCKVQAQDCTKYQKYNSKNCRCECSNVQEKKCFNKIWNPDICSCICRDELTCGTGFDFDPFTCSCGPSKGKKKSSFLYRLYV